MVDYPSKSKWYYELNFEFQSLIEFLNSPEFGDQTAVWVFRG